MKKFQTQPPNWATLFIYYNHEVIVSDVFKNINILHMQTLDTNIQLNAHERLEKNAKIEIFFQLAVSQMP